MRIQYEGEVAKVMAKHFPDAPPDRIGQLAGGIAERAIMNKAAERNLGGMKGKAATLAQLRSLNDRAVTLGYMVQGELGTEARQMLQKKLQLDHDTDIASVCRVLEQLCNASAEAHRFLESQPGSPPPATKPKRFASRVVAREALRSFEEFSGQRATINTNPKDSKAYGPYLDYLTDLFEILRITASPEAAGRDVIKENRAKRGK